MILNIILLSWSVVLSTAYLIYVRRFGKLNSISAYAEPLTKRNLQFLTNVFIWLAVCFPLAWVANHWTCTVAAALLTLDGLFTGYNPTHLKRAWQNILHLIGVDGAIAFFILGMFLINWKVALYTSPLGLLCILLWAKKVKRHTYWIEILLCAWIVLFLIIARVILK